MESHYLGHRVDQIGVHIQGNYIRKVVDWPVPSTGAELASFLALTGFFKSFLPQFTSLTNEIEEAKHCPNMDWMETMDIAFIQIKDLFERRPVRAFPDLTRDSQPFTVTPELFGNSVGAVLEQKQDGVIQFIAATGRRLIGDEPMYSPTDRVICSLLFACRE